MTSTDRELTSGFAEGEHWKGKPQGYRGPHSRLNRAMGGAPMPSAAALDTAADTWVGGYQYAARQSVLDGAPDETASTLMAAVANSGPTAPPLYRGLMLTNEQLAAQSVVGSTIDHNLGSWSGTRQYAETYSRGANVNASQVPYLRPTLFRLERGGQAVNMQTIGKENRWAAENADEWLTGGRFKVTGVGREGGINVISVQQTHVLGSFVPESLR